MMARTLHWLKECIKSTWWWRFRLVSAFAVICLLLIILVCSMYYFDNHFNVSPPENSHKWGEFGDFIGGVLNPIFALFAFLGLLITVGQQHAHQEESRKFLRLSLVQNLLEKRAAAIEQKLSERWPDEHRLGGEQYEGRIPLQKILSIVGHSERTKFIEYERHSVDYSDIRVRELLNSVTMEINNLVGDLAYLAAALRDDWLENGGDPSLVKYYEKQFVSSIQHLHLLGWFNTEELFGEIFPSFKTSLGWLSVRTVEGRPVYASHSGASAPDDHWVT